MEIGSKAKKIIIWSASGLAAAGLLTGTFFTGMAVAENTEPASVTSEVEAERPERPERGEHGDLPQDNEGGESQDTESQDKDSQDSSPARPDRPERDHGPDSDGDRGGSGHRHGQPESEDKAPAEDAPAQS
ncbi:hypothetical protein [Arthrobacter citreus]|uniref:hypothetical protein n=1 Tax=Arthrobacter citreus TaxID=1670 RepID=UPI0036DE275E